jgi:hypothetical protein
MMNEKRQFKVKTASGFFCLLRSISRLPYGFNLSLEATLSYNNF